MLAGITRCPHKPYALFGDVPGKFDYDGREEILSDGENTISFDLYSRNRLEGENLGNVQITFNVVEDATVQVQHKAQRTFDLSPTRSAIVPLK
ncbi:MAG: hypothetical protein AAFW98_04085 [Pseudomonadota bacterium]